MTILSTCLSGEPGFNNLLFTVGDQFIRSTDGKLYYIDSESKFDLVQNDNHATLINKDWRLKTINSTRNLTKLTSCLSDYTNFVNSLDQNKPILYATFFHRYTNGFFRPIQDEKSAETYFFGRIDRNFASSYISKVPPKFSKWIKPNFLPEINPARRQDADVDDIIFKFESEDEPKVFGRRDQISPQICKLTMNEYGYGNEDFLMDTKNNKCQYLVRQFTNTSQLKQFLTQFGQVDYNVLMGRLPLAADSGKTSLLKGTDDLAIYYQQWLTTQPLGVKNSIINAYCTQNPTAKECLCVMRHLDADYKKFAQFNNFPDSCWFLPCKNSTEFNVPSDLLRPTCPNVCQQLTQFIDNQNIKLSENSNIINCNSSQNETTPPPTNNFKTYMWIGIICILFLLLILVKF